ncbi:class I SAM-dependent DNA methyltransferase [Rhodovibrio sodomensis]|nr:methyltransferase domain-containing protein [Rhodovibrio sodomensis]
MANDFFDKVYRTTEPDAVETLYDDWAGSYDADVTGNGYKTPGRVAAALAAQLPERGTPILDFACGTGLSGAALAAQGFAVIDGCDLSAPMLETARARGIYRHLVKLAPDEAPAAAPGDYGAIAAVGALSPGAAPAHYLDILLDRLVPGGLLALSYNDHTLADPAYTDRLARALETGTVVERVREHGDHLVELGATSTVYILEKQAG